MHEKDIKRMVTKQLKKEFPPWKGLTRKKKRILAKQVLDPVAKDYSFEKEIAVPLREGTFYCRPQPAPFSFSDSFR